MDCFPIRNTDQDMWAIILDWIFSARRTEQLEAERLAFETAAGKERFLESKAETESAISDSIGLIGDRVHPKVEAMLSTPAREFMTIDEEGFRLSIRHYVYERLEKDGMPISRIDVPMKACIDYFEAFMTDIATMSPRWEAVVGSPYVLWWKERGRYDLAWDAALFGYLFYHKRKGNRLTRRDYADMGIRSYYDWYGQWMARHEYNVGKFVADRLPRLLPLVADCPNDVFSKRLRLS